VLGFSYRDADRILDRIRAITAEQVQAVARKYFDDDSLTVVALLPQPLDKAPAKPAPGMRH
jgi:zinc protease